MAWILCILHGIVGRVSVVYSWRRSARCRHASTHWKSSRRRGMAGVSIAKRWRWRAVSWTLQPRGIHERRPILIHSRRNRSASRHAWAMPWLMSLTLQAGRGLMSRQWLSWESRCHGIGAAVSAGVWSGRHRSQRWFAAEMDRRKGRWIALHTGKGATTMSRRSIPLGADA